MRVVGVLLVFAVAVFADSKTPPQGPPWERELLPAQRKALAEDKPVFFYFTKTY